MTRHKALVAVAVIAAFTAVCSAEIVPLERAHSHNDYEHDRPLLDALDHGFCSVEADINLIDGKLLVAHSARETKPERTLEALYLEPLRAQIKKNGGKVYGSEKQFWLLIDIKGDARRTWPVLNNILKQYADILTAYDGKKVTPGTVSVVVDNADRAIAAENVRYAAIDGRLDDLDQDVPPTLMPWISASWQDTFSWDAKGPIPPEELEKLREIVKRVHAQGKKLRFWALPNPLVVWPVLYDEGVDFLNSDSHPMLRDFLLQRK
ncbi:MAG: phosphatidylinositol-specific phospholipase C/glycerophosphodiester phosphodiesterase family protein [Candidatus Hydrogenedentes bacterium]|nr:phosphatidylinositol-specific phospholipase C/glycerophosphodiester phosphodiesterase family protein [Candidatus Hydrogenedentota bacterium]